MNNLAADEHAPARALRYKTRRDAEADYGLGRPGRLLPDELLQPAVSPPPSMALTPPATRRNARLSAEGQSRQ